MPAPLLAMLGRLAVAGRGAVAAKAGASAASAQKGAAALDIGKGIVSKEQLANRVRLGIGTTSRRLQPGATTGRQVNRITEQAFQQSIQSRSAGEDQAKAQAQSQQAGGEAKEKGKSALGLGTVAAVATLGATLPLAGMKIVDMFERLGTSILESSRQLERFHPQIHATYAQLERQQMVIRRETAGGTAGTQQFLGQALMDLRDNLQPMKEDLTILKNAGMAIILNGVNKLVEIANSAAGIFGIHDLIQSIEDLMPEKDRQGGMAFIQALRELGQMEGPKNKPPEVAPADARLHQRQGVMKAVSSGKEGAFGRR